MTPMPRRRLLGGSVLVHAMALACSDTSSTGNAPPADTGGDAASEDAGAARSDASSADGGRLECKQAADCETGLVCCAEGTPVGTDVQITTRCLPTCTTNEIRVEVCTRDGECESGSCRAYGCNPDLPPIRFCEKPHGCREH
jgi:hypothetical protein